MTTTKGRLEIGLLGACLAAALMPSPAPAASGGGAAAPASETASAASIPAGGGPATAAPLLTDALALDLPALVAADASGAAPWTQIGGRPGLSLDYQHRVGPSSTVAATGLFNRYGAAYPYRGWQALAGGTGGLPEDLFSLELGYRWYPWSPALRGFYVGGGVLADVVYRGGNPVPVGASAFDYEYGLALRTGWVWEPFDAWTIDLGAGLELLNDSAQGQSGIVPGNPWVGADGYPQVQLDLLSLDLGYAWAGSGGTATASAGDDGAGAAPSPSGASTPSGRSWWQPDTRLIQPFYGYTTLAMGRFNHSLQADGYSHLFTNANEVGLAAPLGFGGFVLTPRLYALGSDLIQQGAWGAGSTTYAFPLELGLGWRLRFGRLSVEADAFGGALYGYFVDHFTQAPGTVQYGGGWTSVAEAQAGVHYDLKPFVLGVDAGYRYAYLGGSWIYADHSGNGYTFTGPADVAMDFSGASVLASVGYGF